jgi:hypothetical protein
MISISSHCAEFRRVLQLLDPWAWQNIEEWLEIAASVTKVDVDILQHDESIFMCSGAARYQGAREELLIDFVTQLSIFSFIWGGLESCLDTLKLPRPREFPRTGKIHNACVYLTSGFSERSVVSPYAAELAAFRSAVQNCIGYEEVERRLRAHKHLGLPGVGLYAVYKLRNNLAHGSLSFPSPDSEHQPISDHTKMVIHASRLVLLSLQMLFLAHYRHDDRTVEHAWSFSDGFRGEYEEVPVTELLRTFHFERREPNEDGCPVFDFSEKT